MLCELNYPHHQLIIFIVKELPSLYETVTFGYIHSEQVFSIALCLRIYVSYQDGYHNSEAVTTPCTEGFHTSPQKTNAAGNQSGSELFFLNFSAILSKIYFFSSAVKDKFSSLFAMHLQ